MGLTSISNSTNPSVVARASWRRPPVFRALCGRGAWPGGCISENPVPHKRGVAAKVFRPSFSQQSKAAAVFLVGFVLILQTMTADEVWLLRNDGFALRAFKRLEVHSNHDKWNILYTKMFYKWHFCVYSIDSTFVFLFFFVLN